MRNINKKGLLVQLLIVGGIFILLIVMVGGGVLGFFALGQPKNCGDGTFDERCYCDAQEEKLNVTMFLGQLNYFCENINKFIDPSDPNFEKLAEQHSRYLFSIMDTSKNGCDAEFSVCSSKQNVNYTFVVWPRGERSINAICEYWSVSGSVMYSAYVWFSVEDGGVIKGECYYDDVPISNEFDKYNYGSCNQYICSDSKLSRQLTDNIANSGSIDLHYMLRNDCLSDTYSYNFTININDEINRYNSLIDQHSLSLSKITPNSIGNSQVNMGQGDFISCMVEKDLGDIVVVRCEDTYCPHSKYDAIYQSELILTTNIN